MDLLPFPDEAPHRLLLGFSGGRDSTALLHRLAVALDGGWTHLRAVHIDHGLHRDSADWAMHCAAVAEALGVPITVRRVVVTPDGRGPESAAREARWTAFAAERRDDECLVLAHHRDDQAETLLLALLRGSGERGLSAMRPFTADARGPVWRPLLDTPTEAIERYAQANRLRWVEDPSNADTRLARNALRHVVLPVLRTRFPQADAGLAHSAALLADADALLDAQARRDLAPLLGLDPATLDLGGLYALPPARGRRALRAWGMAHGAVLTRDAIERVFGEWRGLPASRPLRHAQGGHWLRQWQGRLWLTAAGGDAAPTKGERAVRKTSIAAAPWDGRAPHALDGGGSLSLLGDGGARGFAGFVEPGKTLRVGTRDQASTGLRTEPQRPTRSLQRVFADLGVPPWQRPAVPLLLDADGRVLAVADLAYDAGFDAWLRSREARLLWRPPATPG